MSFLQGTAILRMLHQIIGNDTFFEGIARFLKKYEWSTATADDLWAELGQVEYVEVHMGVETVRSLVVPL